MHIFSDRRILIEHKLHGLFREIKKNTISKNVKHTSIYCELHLKFGDLQLFSSKTNISMHNIEIKSCII